MVLGRYLEYDKSALRSVDPGHVRLPVTLSGSSEVWKDSPRKNVEQPMKVTEDESQGLSLSGWD